MKLLYITDAIAIVGGLERVLTDKANWFAHQQGCEVMVVTVCQGAHPLAFPLQPEVIFCDLHIRFHEQYQYHAWKRLLKVRQLRQHFRQQLKRLIVDFAPDVIVCVRLDFVADILRTKGNRPMVFESHASRKAHHFEKVGMLRQMHVWWQQRKVRHAEAVVALTEGDAQQWRKLTPRVTVIPNVVHLNDTGRVSDSKAKAAIYVGRFSYQKDIDSLFRIWQMVRQRHPDWCLHIYGGYGNQQEKYDAIKNSAKVEGIVVHKPTSEMQEAYLNSSLLLLTSRYEPFGLVMPEAMSYGLPVVAFDCPYGPADIITNGVDGYLIANRSDADFADAVCSLIENDSRRHQMGGNAIDASQRYCSATVMQLWKTLFEKLCTKDLEVTENSVSLH